MKPSSMEQLLAEVSHLKKSLIEDGDLTAALVLLKAHSMISHQRDTIKKLDKAMTTLYREAADDRREAERTGIAMDMIEEIECPNGCDDEDIVRDDLTDTVECQWCHKKNMAMRMYVGPRD